MQSSALTASGKLKLFLCQESTRPSSRESLHRASEPRGSQAFGELCRPLFLPQTSGCKTEAPSAEEAGMCCSLPRRILARNSNWRRVILISEHINLN